MKYYLWDIGSLFYLFLKMVELFVGLKAIHLIYNFSDLEPKTYFTFLFRTRHQSQKFILQKRLRSWRLENKLNGNTISKLFKTLDSPSIKPWNMETKWNTCHPLSAWMFATVTTQCKIKFTNASHCVSKNLTPRRMLKKCFLDALASLDLKLSVSQYYWVKL